MLKFAPHSFLRTPLKRSACYCFSDWTGARGHDITYESLTFGTSRPKPILESYSPTGFDVMNVIKKVDPNVKGSGILHMNGSIIVFPLGCFLWKVESPKDVNLASLAAVFLHEKIEYLFIGCNDNVPLEELGKIKAAFKKKNIVVEKMNLANAMGTFNILNAEDRQVAAALVIDKTEEDD